jgi:hypothetical protein
MSARRCTKAQRRSGVIDAGLGERALDIRIRIAEHVWHQAPEFDRLAVAQMRRVVAQRRTRCPPLRQRAPRLARTSS